MLSDRLVPLIDSVESAVDATAAQTIIDGRAQGVGRGSGHGHVDGAADGAWRDGVHERLVATDDSDADFAEQ